jgi:chromosomal replication initiation ATPase DnaA
VNASTLLPEQLILPFEIRAARDRADFIVAPCNEAAVRFIDRWPDWPVKAAALYGPRGSGKSHLVQVWQARSNAAVVAASAVAGRQIDTLAVEDVDAAVSPERDRALMAALDGGGFLLLTGERHPAEWPVAIPDLKSRFAALPAFPLWAPDDTLLRDLARKLFADRQLEVPGAAIARMLTRLPRTPDAVAGFVERLDRFALAERRAINERLVSELLDREGA